MIRTHPNCPECVYFVADSGLGLRSTGASQLKVEMLLSVDDNISLFCGVIRQEDLLECEHRVRNLIDYMYSVPCFLALLLTSFWLPSVVGFYLPCWHSMIPVSICIYLIPSPRFVGLYSSKLQQNTKWNGFVKFVQWGNWQKITERLNEVDWNFLQPYDVSRCFVAHYPSPPYPPSQWFIIRNGAVRLRSDVWEMSCSPAMV